MSRTGQAWVAFALTLGVAACGAGAPVDDVQTRSLYLPPGGAIDELHITVPEGRALAFVAQPMGEGETLKLRIQWLSNAPSIAEVEQTVEMNQFVALGRSVGSATFSLEDEAGRRAEPTLRVDVVAP